MMTAHRSRPMTPPESAFVGFRFPPEVIVSAVRWYLRFGLPHRGVEWLLAERGVDVIPRGRSFSVPRVRKTQHHP